MVQTRFYPNYDVVAGAHGGLLWGLVQMTRARAADSLTVPQTLGETEIEYSRFVVKEDSEEWLSVIKPLLSSRHQATPSLTRSLKEHCGSLYWSHFTGEKSKA